MTRKSKDIDPLTREEILHLIKTTINEQNTLDDQNQELSLKDITVIQSPRIIVKMNNTYDGKINTIVFFIKLIDKYIDGEINLKIYKELLEKLDLVETKKF